MKFNGRGPGILGTGRDPIRSPEWRVRFALKEPKSNLSNGSVACTSALWTGVELLTGTTLIRWGNSAKLLEVNSTPIITVPEWFRNTRQKRFTGQEQDVLDMIIGSAIDRYTELVTSQLGHSEATIRDKSKMLIVKDKNDKDARKKTQLKHLKKENEALKAELLEKLPVAKEKALVELVQHERDRLPVVMKEALKGPSVMGMAYEGQSYSLKRKCPVCEAIFIFATAKPHELDRLKQDYQNVGEADIWRSGCPRGCCAEALLAILLLRRSKSFELTRANLTTASHWKVNPGWF